MKHKKTKSHMKVGLLRHIFQKGLTLGSSTLEQIRPAPPFYGPFAIRDAIWHESALKYSGSLLDFISAIGLKKVH